MNNINSCDKYSPLPVDQKYSLLPDDDIVSCIWEEAGCLYWWVPLPEEEGRVAEPETRTTPAMDQSHSQDPGHVDHHPDLGTNQRSVLYYCINQSEKSIALYQPIREEYYLEEAVEQLQAEQVSCSVSWPRDWTWRSWSLPDLSTNQRLVLYCISEEKYSPGQHHHHLHLVLPDHAPEGRSGVWAWTLSSNVPPGSPSEHITNKWSIDVVTGLHVTEDLHKY